MAYQSEIEKLEQRFREKPEQWFAALADAYRKNGDVDLALDILNTWIERRQTYASGHIVLGRCHLDREDDAQAGAAFERVLELDPENIIALKSLSDIATRRGDTTKAREWLQLLLDVDPMNEDAEAALAAIGAGGDEPAADEPTADEPTPGPPVVTQDQVGTISMEDQQPGAVAGFEPTTAEPESEPEPGPEPASIPEPEAAPPAELESVPEVEPADPFVSIAEADASTEPTPPVIDFDATLPIETAGIGMTIEDEGGVEETVELAGAVEQDEETVPLGDAVSELPADAEATVPMLEPVADRPDDGELGDTQSFDEELGWDEGERVSKRVTPEDLAEAERAHDDGLDKLAAQALPGLAEAEVPELAHESPDEDEVSLEAEVAEPEEVPVQEPAPVVATDESQLLELILPSDVTPEEEPGEREPEPVVTRTMADLYLEQGLYDEAHGTYTKLLAGDPGNEELEAKLREIEEMKATAPIKASPAQRFSVAVTGGESVRDLLTAIAGATPKGDRPSRPKPPPVQQPAMPAGGGQSAPESSFDQFFGNPSTPSQERSDLPPTPPGEDKSFQNWLRDLKT